ncbi:Ycf1p [Orobanche gracilis]
MEEGRNKQLAVTTGFLMGQLIMFISIYYAPLHLTLDRAHTLTVMGVPYILLNFFWNNHKKFFDYESTNSMREFGLLCVFLNTFIFQFLNYFVLPSSMLARSVNIYMFRCNNKMLFVTSSFFGWVIGQFIFMKCLGLVLVWIQQFFYRYLLGIGINRYIRANKYLKSEFRYSVARIFKIILFIICLYTLGRMPVPLFTTKLFQLSQIGKSKQSLVKQDGTDDEEKVKKKKDIEESYLININANEKLKKKESIFKKYEKSFFIFLFDTKRWNRPIYYIEGGIRNEMSQYFFNICKSDGKERISFTYLPSLSFFIEMIKRKISLLTVEKFSNNKFSNPWLYTNKQKAKSFNNEFINRIEALDKNFFYLNMLETRARLCNDDHTKEYLLKRYDPLLNGSFRKKTYKIFLPSSLEKTPLENLIENFGINRIHGILLLPLDTDYQKFNIKQKISRFDKKSLSTEIIEFLTLISRLIIKLGSEEKYKKILKI